jgi:predicted porin
LSGKDNAKATSEAEAQGIKVGPYTVEQEEDIKEYLESFEVALDFGAGLSYSFGNMEVFADFIYSLGMTKVNKEEYAEGKDVKNQNIMINVGMLFGIQ